MRSFITCTLRNIIRMIKSRRMRLAGHVARMGKMGNAYKFLVGKPEGKRAFGMPRNRWEYNIRKEPRETGWKGVDWSHVTQDSGHWLAPVDTIIIP